MRICDTAHLSVICIYYWCELKLSGYLFLLVECCLYYKLP